MAAPDPIHHVQEHVQDTAGYWPLFHELAPPNGFQVALFDLRPYGIQFTLTRFMLLELLAALLIIVIFLPIARRAAAGGPPRGVWWNMFESLLTFIRDEVARPTLSPPEGHHDAHHPEPAKDAAHHGHGDSHAAHADHGHAHAKPDLNPADAYVPFLWTIFLFILFCNLLGMLPFMGSPTASIYVTGALGLVSFAMMHGVAIAKMGFVPYVKSLWPAMDIPFAVAIFLKPMIFVIEVMGTVIKSGVLAVRLFANLFAGHTVLAMILFFIVMAGNTGPALWGGITVASVLGVTALSLLELFVAFLQAYIFTFLTALFMGMALHPAH